MKSPTIKFGPWTAVSENEALSFLTEKTLYEKVEGKEDVTYYKKDVSSDGAIITFMCSNRANMRRKKSLDFGGCYAKIQFKRNLKEYRLVFDSDPDAKRQYHFHNCVNLKRERVTSTVALHDVDTLELPEDRRKKLTQEEIKKEKLINEKVQEHFTSLKLGFIDVLATMDAAIRKRVINEIKEAVADGTFFPSEEKPVVTETESSDQQDVQEQSANQSPPVEQVVEAPPVQAPIKRKVLKKMRDVKPIQEVPERDPEEEKKEDKRKRPQTPKKRDAKEQIKTAEKQKKAEPPVVVQKEDKKNKKALPAVVTTRVSTRQTSLKESISRNSGKNSSTKIEKPKMNTLVVKKGKLGLLHVN